MSRFGTRGAVVGAMSLMVVAVLGLSTVDATTPTWLILALTATIGVANAIGIVPVSAAGVAVVGVAVVGELLDGSGGFVDGLSDGLKVTAALGVAGTIAAALMLPGRPGGEGAPGSSHHLHLHLHRARTPHG